MAIDDTKLAFSSTWDIDQLIDTDTVTISGSGNTPIYTITGSPTLPVYEVQFKPTGSSEWYCEGSSSSSNTLATLFDFHTYISSGVIYINTGSAGTARYFVWSDKVDY